MADAIRALRMGQREALLALFAGAAAHGFFMQSVLAKSKALGMIRDILGAVDWPFDEQQDWVDDKAAELLHDMPGHF